MTTGFGFCHNCGTPLVSVGQKFCAACGLAFSGVMPPGGSNTYQQHPGYEQVNAPPS